MIVRNHTITTKKSGSAWILLEPNKKYIRELNETAGFIWSLLKKPTTPDAIVKKMCQEYDAPRSEVIEDITRFLKEYKKLGLIEEIH
ncbi:MAG: PqqD family protein [Patescibacteria group bacterium]